MLKQKTEYLRGICAAILIMAFTGMSLATETRTVETAFGEVALEGTPERVVTTYEGALDTAIAVGVQPVGAIASRGGSQVARYIEPKADNPSIVGTVAETNLESIIALEPDIILASPRTSEAQYQSLSRIAPTVVPDTTSIERDNWKRETRIFSRALNRGEAGKQMLTRVQDRVEEVSALVADVTPEDTPSAAVVRWMPQGALFMAPNLFSPGLLQDLGFSVSGDDLVQQGRPHSDILSQENLGLIDRDWLFLATLNEDGEQALEKAREAPAFERLEASRNDRIITVDGQLWSSASGPIAALTVIEQVESAMKTRRQ
ncbi:iron-siderophore ABC transporter substrate-binding protein [Vreelandella utahensis]|uniref:ABC transporter substrate-binding protein n=1 Tax=Vreelandella halophila TaxID=86177 RepID=UPI0015C38459|nr:iron-siderophore ABC transporter substrate-binding protein [Halomonas utahensis]